MRQQNRVRTRAATVLCWLTRLVLGLLIVSLPWRLRLVLVDRPQPPIYSDFTDLLLYLPDMMLLGLLLLWVVRQVLRPQPIRLEPAWLWVLLFGLAATGIVSVFGAVDVVFTAYRGLQQLMILLFCLYLANEDISQGFWIGSLFVQLSLQAVIGVGQVWQQQDLGMYWLGEHSLDPGAGSAAVWGEGGLISLKAYGLADHPNILAINLVLGLLMLAVWLASRRGKELIKLLPVGIFFLGSSVVLMLTFAREAWISLAGGGMVVVVWARGGDLGLRARSLAVWAGLTLMFMSPLIWRSLPFLSMGTTAETMAARVLERSSKGAEGQELNRVTNQLFLADPYNGVGLGGLPMAMKHETTDFAYDFQPSRLTLLTVAAETGFMGALFYLLLQIAPWVLIWFNRQRIAATPMLIGWSAALMAISIFSLQDSYSWSYPAGRLWQWLAWGLWISSYQRALRPRSVSSNV